MSLMRRKLALLTGAGLALAPAPALADTLREALLGAYRTNPTLQAARANQRATDENVPIAKAAGLPSATSSVSVTENLYSSIDDPMGLIADRSLGAQLSLSVPVYSGGAVRNSVRAAETRVEAGQADLRSTESAIFSQVVAAYMDVIQNEAIVGLSGNNVSVLEVNLQATSDRFEIGNLTRTDVAQSQSRLDIARSSFRTAQANLISARERYIQLVGEPPVDLQPPPPLPGLPASVEQAVDIALENNPDLIASRVRAEASDFDIDVAEAGRLPKIDVFSNGNYSDVLDSAPGSTSPGNSGGVTAGVRFTMPLFQGGRPGAQVRQAQARRSAALEQEIGTERSVIAQVRAAYSTWQAANAIISSTQSAVDAAALSLEGVRAENSVGNRTILEILNAQQELLNAQVQLVTARRNAYVAGFALLAAMGKAEARDLGLGDEGLLYDPDVNYERVNDSINDWAKDPEPEAQATRTVDTPAQTGEIPAR